MSFTHEARRLVVVLILAIIVPTLRGGELSPDEAVRKIADYLTRNQVFDGNDRGLWPGEESFMGPITAGMADAYDWTGTSTYFFVARWGAFYLAHSADEQGNLLGDEAYAFIRMSEVSKLAEPAYWDFWREALIAFYDSLRRPGYEGSTEVYLRYFDDLEPSTNVFYFAHHVVGAYFVDDVDKEQWLDVMLRDLTRVDNDSYFPVMALGAATWALAEIGKLDDTLVTSDPDYPYWDGVRLQDLPEILLRYQVPEGEPFAGSFYRYFDEVEGDLFAGYTEEVAYCARALATVASLEDNLKRKDMEEAVTSAETAMLQGIDDEGRVYEHLSQEGELRYVFAGELLDGLWSVKQYRTAKANSENTDEAAGSTEGQN